ncbi:MAG: hypothetical protein JWM57_1956, partial [Phycisphaerales bacterium]|nr:hypothetical protein [Phycisphaerales bacterium]
MAAKFTQISDVIEARLKNGEYSVNGMPGERQIAIEMGVSHMTARRAVQELVIKGLIPRRPVGRITRADARMRPECDLHIALVAHAFASDTQTNWHNALEQVVAQHNGQVRCFGYFNPYDRALTDSLQDEFDGVFLVPPVPMPPLLLERLKSVRHKVVTLFHDLTEHGIPCVNLASPRLLWRIAKHFADLGHTHVDCLNTQPSSKLIDDRMRIWAEAAKEYGLDTIVHNHEVEAFVRPDERAHLVAPLVIANPNRRITGLFCTTSAAARGVMRAAHEHGIRVGQDLSLASCDNTR